jgi:endogenous inhibitor of DNA gyrase (YacG/DUF329 family)
MHLLSAYAKGICILLCDDYLSTCPDNTASMSIQFFDCPNCGKSLRVGARECHHCHAVDENDWADPDRAVEYAEGGYTEDKGDDYGPPTAWEVWQRRIVVVIVMLLLLSFLLQALFLL